MILIKHLQINQVAALNNSQRVDMPLNKLIKPKQKKARNLNDL